MKRLIFLNEAADLRRRRAGQPLRSSPQTRPAVACGTLGEHGRSSVMVHRSSTEGPMSASRFSRFASRRRLMPASALGLAFGAAALLAAHLHAAMRPPAELDYARTRTSAGGAYQATFVPEVDP